jgi:predicted MFS family arabinose efflux permease
MEQTFDASNPSPAALPTFTSYQKFVVGILSFLQFTIILDFMIMSPLGATIMPVLKISPSQFGVAVSVYAFAAGVSGLIAASFADKFDRKKLLLVFYAGFLAGTLLCGIAPTYHFLLAARLVTGMFGGVIGAIAFAITVDLFAVELRGRVMGILQTSFAASQILGLPAGLFLSNHFGWHSPFLMIVTLGIFAGLIILVKLKPVTDHLKLQKKENPFSHLFETFSNKRYQLAFAATALLSIGGFMLMPFGSAFTVNNMGISIDKLPMIYLITGLCAIVIGPLVGRASDRFGAFRVFIVGTVISLIMVPIYTNLGLTPLWMVILINAIMFVGIFSRMIPSQTLMSVIPEAKNRGSFMSVSSSLQQICGGFASVVAGSIVVANSDGTLLHFDILGYVMMGTATIALIMMYFIHRMVSNQIKN